MKEIIIEMKLDTKTGLTFSGADEVNSIIKHGGKVTSIKPAIVMHKHEDDNEHLYISGWNVHVIMDDSNVDFHDCTQ